MFLTICIPTYNRAHTILRTLESLVNQTCKDFEVLIIDDGSYDDTENQVNHYLDNLFNVYTDVKYIKKTNGGKYTAINLGLDNAHGEYFMILDSDDWLPNNSVEIFKNLALEIKNEESYSGIIGKCSDSNGELIGDVFPDESLTYIEMHFPEKRRFNFKDCCEINRTDILRRFKFPEYKDVKFIPEAYMFDQVGLEYKLYCTNSLLKIVEYQEDGITLNNQFKQNNIKGYLINYQLRLKKIVPNLTHRKVFYETIAWWRFWDAYNRSGRPKELRVSKLSLIGRLIRLGMPILNLIYRFTQKELYKSGR
ncbi:glycosyltransferase family 2 protein [Solibacillus sp. FSL W7-1436]|uniref:glycosyltransferase family 2 protein n=1 Tax=Solibacillus sp. FSL W7-1436 TaxID=2921705 RepID=UPI0030F831CF